MDEDVCQAHLLEQARHRVDIVQVATLQSYIGTEHPYTKLDWSQIPAFAKLGLDPSKNMHEDEDLSAAMEAAMSMLQ